MTHFPMKSTLILTLAFLIFLLAGCGDTMQRVYLQGHQAQVNEAVSDDIRPVRFRVEPGTPARLIGQQLQTAGLIQDARLFEAYVRVSGVAAQLEAGDFVLSPAMTLA